MTYDYGYGRTYDTSKTYYQQAPTTATYAAAAQPYADATAQPAPKVAGYQTAQYVAGPTRNNIQPQQAKANVPTATYNANQGYASQPNYSQNAPNNSAPKRNFISIQSHAIVIVQHSPICGFCFFFFLLAPASTTTQSNYSSYDAALYSAATMYVAQQTNKQPVCNG